MDSINDRSRPTESGRKDQDTARGDVHGQPRSGTPRGPHGADVQPFKQNAPEAFGKSPAPIGELA